MLAHSSRRMLLAGFLLMASACASGPPKPLPRQPGADLPPWVVDGYQARRPLADEPAVVNTDADADGGAAAQGPLGPSGPQQPQTRPAAAPRVPARVTAVGQARHEDPQAAEQQARRDAERALHHLLDARLRRALLRAVSAAATPTLPPNEREALRGRIWRLDFASTLAGLPVQLRQTAWDEPPEVPGPPVTFVEAIVPFEAVLGAASEVAHKVLGPHAPSRQRLARWLAEP